jgi:hypothetical protein
MKKVLLTLAVAFIATSSYATREVDWSVDTILSPTNLNSTDQGTSFLVDVVLKNNGVDSVYATDTFWIQFAVFQGSNIVLLYPGPATNYFAPFPVKKKLGPGDTIHFTRSFNSNLRAILSFNINFSVASLIVNRKQPDNIVAETSPTTANNVKNKAMIWYNPQKWGVGINDVSDNGLTKVYPNPTSDKLHISMNVVDVTAPLELNIMDHTGKVVYSETAENVNDFNVSMANFPKGLYLVQVKSGEIVNTTKVSVQ